MCLNTWSFKPVNVDKISCTNCVLRWTWEGHHISPTNPEKFENCIDVTIKNSPDTSSNYSESYGTESYGTESSVSESYGTESSVSDSQENDCACDLKVDSFIYGQCTADGNYCACLSGPWSVLGKVKMNCPSGTTCRQSESQIHCE